MPRQSVTLAPFTAGATIFVHRHDRFNAKRKIDLVARCGVSTTCATPTVRRLFILEDLHRVSFGLRFCGPDRGAPRRITFNASSTAHKQMSSTLPTSSDAQFPCIASRGCEIGRLCRPASPGPRLPAQYRDSSSYRSNDEPKFVNCRLAGNSIGMSAVNQKRFSDRKWRERRDSNPRPPA